MRGLIREVAKFCTCVIYFAIYILVAQTVCLYECECIGFIIQFYSTHRWRHAFIYILVNAISCSTSFKWVRRVLKCLLNKQSSKGVNCRDIHQDYELYTIASKIGQRKFLPVFCTVALISCFNEPIISRV